ncbi:MAG: acetylornithine transaminase [Candidatus Omnitrophica bacterium]|nr:acetylornithine transaminase [Candidatus Omnitrophota bacterium]
MDTLTLYDKYVMATYTRSPLILVRGQGIKVWDSRGREYLDFFPGWAVSGIGHCHPGVVDAVQRQLKKIIHVSNNYYNELQGRLAQKISENSFSGKVFFCNSGAEANESAIKLARAYGHPDRYEILSMEGSFHGRTLAAMTATGQEKYHKGFGPLPKGFTHVPFNNLEAIKAKAGKRTIAVLIELIQGEGGINIAGERFVRALRRFCTDKDILLIIDEVQTGMGRTGRFFAYQHYGIEPDIMTMAKTLGGGMPIGAMLAGEEFASILKPGTHASTFGGSPIVCAASLAVFEAIEKEGLIRNAETMGKYLKDRLNKLKDKHSIIKEIRGMGLMLGVELKSPGKDIVEGCIAKGLLINCTHNTVLRLMPPMIVEKKDIDKAIGILDEVLS